MVASSDRLYWLKSAVWGYRKWLLGKRTSSTNVFFFFHDPQETKEKPSLLLIPEGSMNGIPKSSWTVLLVLLVGGGEFIFHLCSYRLSPSFATSHPHHCHTLTFLSRSVLWPFPPLALVSELFAPQLCMVALKGRSYQHHQLVHPLWVLRATPGVDGQGGPKTYSIGTLA